MIPSERCVPEKNGFASKAKAINRLARARRRRERLRRTRHPSFPPTPLCLSFFSRNPKNLFTAALNPTYTYGKRADSGDNNAAAASAVSGWARTDGASSGASSPVEIAAAKASAPGGGAGASTPPKVGTPPLLGTTPPKKVYDHHGHKGNLLMNPLPDVVAVAPAAEKA